MVVLRFHLFFALLQAILQSPNKGPLGPTFGSELGKTKWPFAQPWRPSVPLGRCPNSGRADTLRRRGMAPSRSHEGERIQVSRAIFRLDRALLCLRMNPL